MQCLEHLCALSYSVLYELCYYSAENIDNNSLLFMLVPLNILNII